MNVRKFLRTRGVPHYSFKNLHWQHQKKFFSPVFVRFFISWFAIVPIFQFVFISVHNPIHFPDMNINLILDLPFRWELLWVGSLLYSFCYALYQTFCPNFVKLYSDFGEYKQKGHSSRSIIWEIYYCIQSPSKNKAMKNLVRNKYARISGKYLTEKYDIDTSGNSIILYFKFSKGQYEIDLSKMESSDWENDIFWIIFGAYATSWLWVRALINLLIILCFFIVVITILETIIFMSTQISLSAIFNYYLKLFAS